MRKVICFALVSVFFSSASPARAEYLKTSLFDIELNPPDFYGKEVQVEAHFYKESDIWVDSLDQPSRYIGFFVTKPQKDILALHGEYFGFIFAPEAMKTDIRLLRQGDKITIRGECFEFRSTSIQGPGIEVSELLSGWGEDAKPITTLHSEAVRQAAGPLQPQSFSVTPSVALKNEQRFTLFLNGREYQGLRFGDEYTFEGTRFRIEKEKDRKE